MTRDVVFTMNMQHAVDRSRARAGLVLTARSATLGGCQEWGADRLELLRLPGWSHDGQRRPNLWRRDLFRFLDGYLDVLDAGGKVKRLPGRRAELGHVVSRVTVLEDRDTGEHVSLLNFHLPAAIETGGRPRTGSGSERVLIAERSIAHLVDDFESHDAHGTAYAFGDQNVDARLDLEVHHPTFPARKFAGVGAVPCWLGNMPPRRDGTHHRRLIDVVYAADQSQNVDQVKTASDHDAIRAEYARPALP